MVDAALGTLEERGRVSYPARREWVGWLGTEKKSLGVVGLLTLLSALKFPEKPMIPYLMGRMDSLGMDRQNGGQELLTSNSTASIFGAFMYFATLT